MTALCPPLPLTDTSLWDVLRICWERMFYGTPEGPEERAERQRQQAEDAERQRQWLAADMAAVIIYGGAVDHPGRARDVDVGYYGVGQDDAHRLGTEWASRHGFAALPVELHPLNVGHQMLGFRAYSARQRHVVLASMGGPVIRPHVEKLDGAGSIRAALLLTGAPCPALANMNIGEAGAILVALSKGDGWTRDAVMALPASERLVWVEALVAAYRRLATEARPDEVAELRHAVCAAREAHAAATRARAEMDALVADRYGRATL